MNIEILDSEIRGMLRDALNREPTREEIRALALEASRTARQWLDTKARLLVAARNTNKAE